jgi:DNA invertase Pin-like site-specific DNA recombinase
MSDGTEPNAAIIYAAKSTEDKHNSIGGKDDGERGQLDDCRDMAAREGWKIVGEFSDEGFSAYSGNRGPGLAAARQKAVEVAPSVLVCQHSDRLARGAGDAPGAAEHLAEILFWARRHNVQLRSVQDDFAFTHPLLTFALGERNYEDSRRKGLAVKSGMQRRAKRGLHNGGPRPYGYLWQAYTDEHGDIRKRLVVHEPEAAIIRRIYAEFVAGRGQRAICRGLNADGITSQRGGTWHQGTLANYLASPLYKGSVRLNGEVFDGQHEAIVDAETWEKARQLREAIAHSDGGGRGRCSSSGHVFTKGLLRCGRCGEAMMPRSVPNRTPGSRYEVYLCYGKARSNGASCDQRPVRREPIDSAVWRFFERVALDVDATKRAIAEANEGKLAEFRSLREQAAQEAQRAFEALTRIERDYIDGKITAEQWGRLEAKLTTEAEAAGAEAERLAANEDALRAELESFDAETAALQELAALRAMIATEARHGRQHGVDAFRAALRRLFVSFELLEGTFGQDCDEDCVVWDHDDLGISQAGRAFTILPRIRPDVITDWWDEEAGYPALERTALTIRGNNANGLASTSSAPRSSARTRASSSVRLLSTTRGRCGSIPSRRPPAPRTASSSPSVSPLRSARTRCARRLASSASAWSRVSADATW